MAKAWTVEGITPDKPLKECIQKIILIRFAETFSYKAGVLENNDIEYVHDFRVSARRLRSVMQTFKSCFSEKEYGLYFQTIRKIAKVLGNARDLDVMIDFLQKYDRSLSKKRQYGIENLIIHQQKQRAIQQKNIISLFETLNTDHFEEEFIQHFQNINISDQDQTKITFGKEAHRTLPNRLTDLLQYESKINDPKNITDLHNMRISAKRLRYMMEIFEPCYSAKRMKNAQNIIKRIQDVIGQIHDCDVMIPFLQTYIKKIRRNQYEQLKYFIHSDLLNVSADELKKKIYNHNTYNDLPGIFALLADQRVLRDKLYYRFITYWEKLRKKSFEKDLNKLFTS